MAAYVYKLMKKGRGISLGTTTTESGSMRHLLACNIEECYIFIMPIGSWKSSSEKETHRDQPMVRNPPPPAQDTRAPSSRLPNPRLSLRNRVLPSVGGRGTRGDGPRKFFTLAQPCAKYSVFHSRIDISSVSVQHRKSNLELSDHWEKGNGAHSYLLDVLPRPLSFSRFEIHNTNER